MQPSICDGIQSCKICVGYKCNVTPVYVGNTWADIVCHACWIFSMYFWFPTVCSFMMCNIFELLRRAKLVEVRWVWGCTFNIRAVETLFISIIVMFCV